MRLLITFLLFMFALITTAQISCPEGNLTITTQQEINNFPSNYPNCSSISGDLTIDGNEDITNVDSLIQITSIDGNLNLDYNYELLNLFGFASLKSIGGDLEIHENDSLKNLKGLENLTSIGGGILIDDCYRILNFEGLEGLTHVPGNLRVNENYVLNSIKGLENIVTIGGSLDLEDAGVADLDPLSKLETVGGYFDLSTGSLSSISGLSNLSRVGGNMYISSAKLENIDALQKLTYVGGRFELQFSLDENLMGLQNLDTIGGGLELYELDRLENLDYLQNLKYIAGEIELRKNDLLSSISGLSNIASDSISQVEINNNPMLNNCSIQPFCEAISNTNTYFNIENNGIGCNSTDEIETICEGGSVDNKQLETSTLTLYFNQIKYEFIISSSLITSQFKYALYNQLGQLIDSGTLQANNNYDNTLKKGLYIMHLQTNSESMSQKIVIR